VEVGTVEVVMVMVMVMVMVGAAAGAVMVEAAMGVWGCNRAWSMNKVIAH
jgi:hypothetical protein